MILKEEKWHTNWDRIKKRDKIIELERPDEIMPLKKEKEGHPKGWSSIIELTDIQETSELL